MRVTQIFAAAAIALVSTFSFPNTGDSDNQRRNHDRDNDHLDQTDKDIAGRLQNVTDPPGLFSTEMVEQRADCNPEDQTNQDLPGEAKFCLLHVITLTSSGLGQRL